MTEEEKIEWAKTYKRPPRKRGNLTSISRNSKKKLNGKLGDKRKDEKRYSDPERKAKTYNAEYFERLRFLYTYNIEYREAKKFDQARRTYKQKRNVYDKWRYVYYLELKGNMDQHASTFKLEGQELYLTGFTFKDIIKYAPVGVVILKHLYNKGVIPPPVHKGYKFKEKKVSDVVEDFYLVTEIEEFLNAFAIFEATNKKITDVGEQYLQKQFWTRMNKARKEFDER